MTVGTRSILFGVHQFLLHPLLLARAWYTLYGWRTVTDRYVGKVSLRDWRLWVTFFVHDLGYWGKPNMDGDEGELHPNLGGDFMERWHGWQWGQFSRYHSRFLAKRDGAQPSLLCAADKLVITMYPDALYLRLANWSGEIDEYMRLNTSRGNYGDPDRKLKRMFTRADQLEWLRDVKTYIAGWVAEHKDGKDDSWTAVHGDNTEPRTAVGRSGVWR